MVQEYPRRLNLSPLVVGATTEVTSDNVCAINYRQNEGAFLAGVLAASITTSQKIGAWVFKEVPIGHDFVAG